MSNKQKLELTWVGKDRRHRLEPRILLEDPELSYHAKKQVTEHDLFDNKLIFGDNLLALKALEQEYRGKVKCIYIDPPYNTGSAFTHYDDGLEHSIWLGLMRDRLELLKELLSEEGSIWITLDDNEVHYLKVMCDEIFGRSNFVANIIWRSSDASNNDTKRFSLDHNSILVYSKSQDWTPNALPRTEEANKHYSNPDNDPNGPWFSGNLSSPKPRQNLRYNIVSPQGHVIPPPPNGWRWKKETLNDKIKSGEIIYSPDGRRIIKKTYLKDQKGLAPSTLWDTIDDTGHNRQAKYELKKLFPEVETSQLFSTPKPERLLERIIYLATNLGDIVFDSFAGSGTTGAVAHKMGRRWIMVELGEHAHTHIIPRMRKVIDGTDQGGISQSVGWKGGGGFRYFKLAPSLLQRDKWGNWVINKTYNPEMLAEALCKLEGFTYHPSDSVFWQQGYSSENDYIYVTTQILTETQIRTLHEEVGEDRSLLIMCSAFRGDVSQYSNLTLKKIPHTVLDRCEWGEDDYSLNVRNLPLAESVPINIEVPQKPASKNKGLKEGTLISLFGSEE